MTWSAARPGVDARRRLAATSYPTDDSISRRARGDLGDFAARFGDAQELRSAMLNRAVMPLNLIEPEPQRMTDIVTLLARIPLCGDFFGRRFINRVKIRVLQTCR